MIIERGFHAVAQADIKFCITDDIFKSGEDPENSGLQEVTTQMPTMAITTTATTVQSSVNTGNKLVSYPTLYKGCIASVGVTN